MSDDYIAGPIPPPLRLSPRSAAPPFDSWALIRRWARILLARNPFYIISAALLLWSMRRLSLDSRVFTSELPQLLFNFSSFQVYELLLAGTAIVLARRRVWYDSGLLVGLDNLFICVPFLLVSQALLLENWIAFALCLAGCGLALMRVGALRRWLKELNMPATLLWSGAFLLCFNLAWPVLIRFLHKDVAMPSWDHRGLTLVSWQWNWIIPGAVALAALLPVRPFVTTLAQGEETPFYSWRSFPLLALFMWVAGTCVHLYCISYVYGLPWSAGTAGAGRMDGRVDALAARQAKLRAGEHLPCPATHSAVSARAHRVGVRLVGARDDVSGPAVLNALACGAIFFVRRDRFALHLCAVSVLLGLAADSCHIRNVVRGGMNLGEALWGGGLLYVVAWAVFSARPKLGIAGGICLGFGLAGFLRGTTVDLNFAVQAGLMFILLHSLRWSDSGSSDAANARRLCGLYWLVHTAVWVAAAPAHAISVTMSCGARFWSFIRAPASPSECGGRG